MTVRLATAGLGVRTPARTIVRDVAFQAGTGELVAVVGPSGSGKSTFLRALCGRCARGLTVHASDLVFAVDGAEVRPLRTGFAGLLGAVVTHLPQEAGSGLDPYRTVAAQVEASARRAGRPARVEPWLEQLGFDVADVARVARSRPHTLSGGMAERVAIAQVLAVGSPLLLCDEPTTGLDVVARRTVLQVLRRSAAERLVVVVTHDLPSVAPFADRVLRFDAGRLAEVA